MEVSTDVTMIGLGPMGTALGKAFIGAGSTVTVWNRNRGRARPLQDAGATLAQSLASAVSASPLIVTCLHDYAITRRLLDSPEVSTALAGRVLVNTASGTPTEAEDMLAFATRSRAGYLDAKLMTYPLNIGAPETVIFFAGDPDLYFAHRRELQALAGKGTFLGADITSAATFYQGIWLYYYCAVFGFIESAAFLQNSGIPIESFLPHAQRFTADVLWHIADVTKRVSTGNFSGDQAESTTYVDSMAAMRDTFVRADIDSRMLAAVCTLVKETSDKYGAEDIAAMFKLQTGTDT